jgi:LPXTG-motif cell wall-anchored protein
MHNERVTHGDINSRSIASGVAGPTGGRARRFGIALLLVTTAGGVASLALSSGAGASDIGHTLYVTDADTKVVVTYDSYKHSGDAIHWETPVIDPSDSVAFPERGQTWDGNGSRYLEGCETGLHWISNDNVLTLSHCLDNYESTTTEETTTTAASTTAASTTAASTTAASTTAASTTPGEIRVASQTPQAPTQAAVDPASVQLPATGNSSWVTALIALVALLGGTGLVRLSRRSTD